MKRKLIIFCCIAFVSAVTCKNFAQPYTFAKTTSPYQNLPAGIALHANDSISWWDDAIGKFIIPFSFKLFGNTIDSMYFIDAYLTDDTVDWNYDLIAFGANIWGNSTPVSYQITGSAPNRIYKVEWTDIGFDVYEDNSTAYAEFQLWLYETNNVIEIHFGSSSVPDPATAYEGIGGPQIALAYYDNDPQNLLFLTGNASNPTVTNDTNAAITGTPAMNTVYRFTPNPSSTEEDILQQEVAVYPCPAVENLTMESFGDAIIEILNMEGQLMKELKIKANKTNIDVSYLSSGVYIIKAKTDKGITTKKFIKE